MQQGLRAKLTYFYYFSRTMAKGLNIARLCLVTIVASFVLMDGIVCPFPPEDPRYVSLYFDPMITNTSSHCAFSSNLFHWQMTQKHIDQLSSPEEIKFSP